MIELYEEMQDCTSCRLCDSRTQIVPGIGNVNSSIVFVGEAPGEDEDTKGEPFVGRAGQKLDSILSYVGLERDDIYITNSVLCRPPNNRNPNKEELAACRWRLEKEIEIINPELVVVLGKVALQQVLGHEIKGALTQFFREDWDTVKIRSIEPKLMVTYHPSYLLRSPDRGYKITLPHWTKLKEWNESRSANCG